MHQSRKPSQDLVTWEFDNDQLPWCNMLGVFQNWGDGEGVLKSILQVGPDWIWRVLSFPPDLLWKLFIERLCKYDDESSLGPLIIPWIEPAPFKLISEVLKRLNFLKQR